MIETDSQSGPSWYSVSHKLIESVLKVRFDPSSQDGLGEFVDPDRLSEYCTFYFDHPDLHPIARAECVDAILGSLSDRLEQGRTNKDDLARSKDVVLDAQHNPWAASLLNICASEFDPSIDPGDDAVSKWLQSIDELDRDLIRRHIDSLKKPD